MKLLAPVLVLAPVLALGATKVPDTIKQINGAAAVFEEVNSAPDGGIPRELLEKALCIGILPSLRHAGLIVGESYGRGVVVCRNKDISSGWAGPAFISIASTSLGLQAGLGDTDLIFLVMNQEGMNKLMAEKFDARDESVPGPVGEDSPDSASATKAEVLSYSRARGKFTGTALPAGAFRPFEKDNRLYYGPDVTISQILTGAVKVPHTAGVLTSTLDEYIPGARKKHGRER